jgi:ribosome-binding factor A
MVISPWEEEEILHPLVNVNRRVVPAPEGAAVSNPRVRKVADRIQVVVAEMLERRVKDPRLGFVTVTDVRVSGDTQQASIFYTVLGEEAEVEGSRTALESAKGLIRAEVAKQLGMRHAPTLEFIHDALPDSARHIDELLSRARESDAAVAASAAGATYAGDADPYRKPHEEDPLDDPDDSAPTGDEQRPS